MSSQIYKDAYTLAERLNDVLADHKYPLSTCFMAAIILAKEFGYTDESCSSLYEKSLSTLNLIEISSF